MAVPPPPPPPDPPSTDPLRHPTSFPSSYPQASPSDLVRSDPDLAAISSSAGQSSSGHAVLRQSPCQQASNGSSAQALNVLPAIRTSDLSAAGLDLAAAGSFSGHLSSAQALPLQPSRQPASSSLRSSCLPADRAAAGSISAAVRDPSSSDPSHPQITSVLPLLASVLQPPATSLAIPSSSSLPPTSQTATLHPPCSGSSMVCSKGPLDTPLFSAPAQFPVPIGSTPGVRINASTKLSSANPLNHPPRPTPLHLYHMFKLPGNLEDLVSSDLMPLMWNHLRGSPAQVLTSFAAPKRGSPPFQLSIQTSIQWRISSQTP